MGAGAGGGVGVDVGEAGSGVGTIDASAMLTRRCRNPVMRRPITKQFSSDNATARRVQFASGRERLLLLAIIHPTSDDGSMDDGSDTKTAAGRNSTTSPIRVYDCPKDRCEAPLSRPPCAEGLQLVPAPLPTTYETDPLNARGFYAARFRRPFYTSPMLATAAWVFPHVLAAGASVVSAWVDIREMRLPNRLVGLVAAAAGWLAITGLALGASPQHLGTMALGALLFAVPLGVVWLISPASLGFGDVKYAAAAGAFIGWYSPTAPLWALAGAFLLAAPVAVLLAITKGRKALMPLGPFLVASSIIVGATQFAVP